MGNWEGLEMDDDGSSGPQREGSMTCVSLEAKPLLSDSSWELDGSKSELESLPLPLLPISGLSSSSISRGAVRSNMLSEDALGALGILDGKDTEACVSVEVETLGAKLALVKMSGLRGQIPDHLQV
jgi:hypothetical protein